MSWDVTRRQVRSLETKLDAALNQYSRLAVNITGGHQGASAWPGTEVEEGRKTMGDDSAAKENIVLEQEIEQALSEVSTDISDICSFFAHLGPAALVRIAVFVSDKINDYSR
jgi:hypothetical protein